MDAGFVGQSAIPGSLLLPAPGAATGRCPHRVGLVPVGSATQPLKLVGALRSGQVPPIPTQGGIQALPDPVRGHIADQTTSLANVGLRMTHVTRPEILIDRFVALQMWIMR